MVNSEEPSPTGNSDPTNDPIDRTSRILDILLRPWRLPNIEKLKAKRKWRKIQWSVFNIHASVRKSAAVALVNSTCPLDDPYWIGVFHTSDQDRSDLIEIWKSACDDSTSSELRERALLLVAVTGQTQAADILLRQLQDDNVSRLIPAVRSLGHFPIEHSPVDRDYFTPRLIQLLQSGDSRVLTEVAPIAGRIAGKPVLEALKSLLNSDSEIGIRKAAAAGIGEIGGSVAFVSLLSAEAICLDQKQSALPTELERIAGVEAVISAIFKALGHAALHSNCAPYGENWLNSVELIANTSQLNGGKNPSKKTLELVFETATKITERTGPIVKRDGHAIKASSAVEMQRPDALDACEELLAIDPYHVYGLVNKTRALMQLADAGEAAYLDEALEVNDLAIAVEPSNIQAWVDRSQLMGRRGRHEESDAALQRAKELDAAAG